MRVTFIEIDTDSTWSVASLGPGYLAAHLRDAGHHVSFFRAKIDASIDSIVAQLEATDPGLLGLSLTTRQWLRAKEIAVAVKAALGTPIIAGGLHPTFAPAEVLATPGFDYVCLGEGEGALLDLANALDAGVPPIAIPNIWRKGGIRPPVRPAIEPIDALPFMARDVLDEHRGVVHLTTQRGCPFPCTYCAARMYNEMYKAQGNEYGRRRSPQNVIEELLKIQRTGGLSYVIFLDDTFTIHHHWVRDFCAQYKEVLGTPFSINARVETVNPVMLQMMADAGCKHVIYGVESGSYRVRKEIMRRPVKNQRFIDVFNWTRDAGMMVTANYMMGIPGETREDLQATLALAEELAAYDFGYFVFYPYPGTPLYQTCVDEGLLPDDFETRAGNHRESVLKLKHISQADIDDAYERFTQLRERTYLARQPAPHAKASIVEQIRRHARHA